ncbi:PAAR domain-containing protein [Tenacibaculum jejuense]|uniref:PAAR repeat-containing protein n=1 Tax=Tenacibaculum jejuense TaxID=584609 RepID=A0A238U5X5_9FLAO|nr:PAAR domain-containing protein [Tenacibaculum jejuense]SNR14445.1 conserved protein of unknown function [Tenacibaculum jejuense]
MAKMIVTVGDTHSCPMVSGTVPHVGGTVISGCTTVLLNDSPVARMGDKVLCTGTGMIATIIQGDANVLVGGKPIAYVGCMTSHGGFLTSGQANALITGNKPTKIVTMPVEDIDFPNIDTKNKVLAYLAGHGSKLNEAIVNQALIKQAAQDNEGEPKVFNYKWVKEETIVRDRKQLKVVTLIADVQNIPDGQTASIKVKTPPKNEDEEAQIIELTGTVENKKVTVEWEIEDSEQENDPSNNRQTA